MNAKTQRPGTEHEGAASLAGKYLTFRLAGNEFGLEIRKVQEIVGMLPVTALPRMPAFVRGVVNLRGRIVPVIDLRAKFALPAAQDTALTCIIVVDVASPRGRLSLGLIVDEVSDVMDLGAEGTRAAPEIVGGLPLTHVLGMGIVGDAVKVLLDIEQVMSFDELEAVHADAPSPLAN